MTRTIDATETFDAENARADEVRRFIAFLESQPPTNLVPVTVAFMLDAARQLEQLQRERAPFRVVIDRALERGLEAGHADAAVLALAERLGFREPVLNTGREVLVSFLGAAQRCRIVNIRSPLKLPGIPLLRIEVIGNNEMTVGELPR